MLLLVRSLGVDFTAFITSRLSRTVKGQVMVLMMIRLVTFVTFVELAEEMFAMLNLTLNPNKLGLS